MDQKDPLQQQHHTNPSNTNGNSSSNGNKSDEMLDVQRSNSSFGSPVNNHSSQLSGPGPSHPHPLFSPMASLTMAPSLPVPVVPVVQVPVPVPVAARSSTNHTNHHSNNNSNKSDDDNTRNPPTTYSDNFIIEPSVHGPFAPPASVTNNASSSTVPPLTRESVLQRLSEALLRRSLAKIDLSQKGLAPSDARLVKMALMQNRQLRVLKLGYNQLGDAGIQTLVSGIAQHAQLQSLDLGFNNISDIGCQALAQAIMPSSTSKCQLLTLYLAGNCIGPDGAMALADVLRQPCALQKLYMTGNRLGAEGVKALTEAILEEAANRNDNNCNYNNNQDDQTMGDDASLATSSSYGVSSSSTGAVPVLLPSSSFMSSPPPGGATTSSLSEPMMIRTHNAMQELFLGGTSLGSVGCQAVGRLLASPDCRLKVLSLANCDITDEEITRQDGGGIALAIKGNRGNLPLQSLQLSFNAISHKGLEALMNALWGSRTLQELRIDNNDIGDRGAQQIAAILPYLKTLETLDVGFNNINNKNHGMKILMKAVAETSNLKMLSLSGNPLQDVTSAKAVAYALAYNTSLQSLLLVHCQLTTEGQRHVAAGAVSNSRTSLRELSGFPLGPVIVTLGFPEALEHWTNEQVLNFVHLMWNKSMAENENGRAEEERGLDPLSFLPGTGSSDKNSGRPASGPLEASIVVDVARKAFASLVANGVDVFSRRPGHPNATVLAPRDAIMLESVDGDSIIESMGEVTVSSTQSTLSNNVMKTTITTTTSGSSNGSPTYLGSSVKPPLNGAAAASSILAKKQTRSFVAPPQERNATEKTPLPDPSRKKRIVEWLCTNIKHLNKMAQMPFDSGELLRLHQHYFTPVVNESGGSGGFHGVGGAPARSYFQQSPSMPLSAPIMEESSISSSSNTLQSGDVTMMIPASDPMLSNGQDQRTLNRPHQQLRMEPPQPIASSLPMLKRKVSYRFLGDATMHQQPSSSSSTLPQPTSLWNNAFGVGGTQAGSVAKMIQDGPSGHSLPPKNKRARRNRSRISFLPRVKAKLDSYLDVCHEKALITMRQLYFVEQAILNGQVNPLEEGTPRTHLSGPLATDAETIVVDMV